MLPAMGDQVLLLVIGFALTSVLGGALGYLFQTRSWAHQHRAQRRDQQHEQAVKVFEEVSSALDKRLYRMRLVFWAAKRCARAGADLSHLRNALADYRKTLEAWNDNLNRTLALVETFFGGAVRGELEDHIYYEYSAIGRALDQFVRDVSVSDREDVPVPQIGGRLTWLSREVYSLNLKMLQLMQQDKLGAAAPGAAPSRPNPTPLLQSGSEGSAVLELQGALHRAGHFHERIDGSFGRKTDEAVRAFQRAVGLSDDGVVDTATWTALTSAGSMPIGAATHTAQDG
jgi:tetratricopeptide (TPR) repeat protein